MSKERLRAGVRFRPIVRIHGENLSQKSVINILKSDVFKSLKNVPRLHILQNSQFLAGRLDVSVGQFPGIGSG